MSLVETEKKDQIFIVRINRPERLNALGYEIRTQLAEAWNEFRESKNLEIGIFTGTGLSLIHISEPTRLLSIS